MIGYSSHIGLVIAFSQCVHIFFKLIVNDFKFLVELLRSTQD